MDNLNQPPHDFTWLWTVITGAFSAAVTYLFGLRRENKELQKAQAEIETMRAKASAEVDGNELENVDKAIAIWRQLAQEMNQQVVSLTAQMKHMQNEFNIMRDENKQLKAQMQQLEAENRSLKEEISKLKN